MKKRSTLFLLSLAALLLLFTTSTALAAETEWKIAPTNEIVRSGGVVSSPVDSQHSVSRNRMAATYPKNFKVLNLTSVRHQLQYGTCWAHSALASSESMIKAKGLSGSPDLSEWQLATFVYESQNGRPAFDLPYGETAYSRGGNDGQATAMLARGTSPVWESTVPYEASTVSPNHKPVFTLKSTTVGHNPNEWKQLLMDKGALSISYYHDEYDYYAYGLEGDSYYTAVDDYPNHAVTLVGWDDNYWATNFPTSGAWLVKNSWGEYWGDNGYFWLSYYSAGVDPNAYCYEYIAAQKENAYTWADLGMISSVGNNGKDTGWMKAVFTATGHELLTAVGTYAIGDNTSYSISVTTQDGNGVYQPAFTTPQAGRIAMAGYQRIELNKPVRLAPRQKYEVIIRYTVPGSYYPIPIECSLPGYSSYARFAAGQTYYSTDGVYWDDAYYKYYDSDAAIYAFTDAATSATYTITAQANNAAFGTVTGGGSYTSGATVTLKATPKAGYRFVNWMESGKVVSTGATYSFVVDRARTLTAQFAEIQSGSYKITVAANSNAYGAVSDGGTPKGGTTFTVWAKPYNGYYFSHWKVGDKTVSRSAVYSFDVTGNRVLTAVFAKIASPIVTATSGGYNSVLLTWKAVPGAAQYQIYRAATKTGKYSWVANTTTTTYRNRNLITGKTYFYKVRVKCVANNKATYGGYSYPKSAKPVPATPKLTATRASSSSIKLSWGKVYGVTKYQVFRATSKTGTYKKIAETTATSYTNKRLTRGKTYYYKVRAYRTVSGKKICGKFSAVKSAKP